MIIIRNQQKLTLDLTLLQQDASIILEALKYSDFDLTILLVNELTMQKYNNDYRKKDYATDILSFPFHTEIGVGDYIVPTCEDDKNLGDIILCPSYILNDLERWEKSFEERIQILLVHGICHLLGYDHIVDEDYLIMKKQEEWLLTKINR